MYTLEQIKSAVLKKGYVWFEDTDNQGYDVNIVGVRTSTTNDRVTDLFDDFITISYKDENNQWQFHIWSATTDPGKKGVLEFRNPNGVSRLIPGQYRGCYSIDLHKGQYQALCQRLGRVRVWRDTNRDLTHDERLVSEGIFGINIHKAGRDTQWVSNWSEGCNVFKRVMDFDQFMKICRRASRIHGNRFTYTLIESNDID